MLCIPPLRLPTREEGEEDPAARLQAAGGSQRIHPGLAAGHQAQQVQEEGAQVGQEGAQKDAGQEETALVGTA